MVDYYEILGVNTTSNSDEIKKAYRKLSFKNHPDRGGKQKKKTKRRKRKRRKHRKTRKHKKKRRRTKRRKR